MNDELTQQVLGLLHTSQALCPELYTAAEVNGREQFQQICADILGQLTAILSLIDGMETVGSKRLLPAVQSIQDTLSRIQQYFLVDQDRCLKKIEFELLPLLQEAYQASYFFWYLTDHPEHLPEYYDKEKSLLGGNSYIDEAIETGRYKYEVSIMVLAYNKLEYTRQCVESLLENIPDGLNYELILLNHGSSDGTKEYFESIHPHKQLDIAVNGGGWGAVNRIVEGEFFIEVSNDVLVMPHVIENLLACMRSDPKIAFAVPTTPNVSNLQTIPLQYSSLEELKIASQNNNRLDPFRWEQRARLCNPIDIRRSSVFLASSGLCLEWWFHTAHPTHWNSFPDDRLSLVLRRNGYKLILAKDAYCYHFGSVTLKDEIRQQNEQKYYAEGRREFYKAFDVDPWGTGFCFDPAFMNRIVGNETGHVEVLGINCGLGSSSLKIKEQIKEYCHNTDCRLSNITNDVRYLQDLRGVSDETKEVFSMKELKSFLLHRTFHYIVWEEPFLTKYKFNTVLSCCTDALAPGGKLLLMLTDQSKKAAKNTSKWKKLGNNWVVFSREGSI